MNSLFIPLALALVLAQFVVPRKLAFLPLLVAVCHFKNEPVFHLGGAFSACKLVILAGLLRAAREGRLVWLTRRQPLDVWVAMWAGWMLLSGLGHHPKDYNPLTIRLSTLCDFVGGYLYARSFLGDQDGFLRFARCLALVVGALALGVLAEKAAHRNVYSQIADTAQELVVREGRLRCLGPFSHPILLGTFAATSAAVLMALWERYRRWALAGLVACGLVVFCSASSGPIVTLLSGSCALGLWRWRSSVRTIRKLVILGFIGLHLVMTAPVWYLMARVDLAGGSTGWHRAELITAALDHLEEWWLIGTDYTRHWIPYGVPWSESHIDITNHYIGMGVNGGLPLMCLFIGILWSAFRWLGRGMQPLRKAGHSAEFPLWCVGSALFTHAFTFLSVSYFDQSDIALAFLLGVVPGVCVVSSAASSGTVEESWQNEEWGQVGGESVQDGRSCCRQSAPLRADPNGP